ncbi:MAG: hypothetical protein K2J51_05820, partial [Alistipes sp.]|nr:hypothetical protein [Alistipes sp.]
MSLVAVAALFAACSQDNENVTPTTGTEDKGILEFGASLPSTRTYLNGNEVYWSEGDKLTVWSDEVQSPRTYVQSAFGSTPQSATFTFTPTAEIPTGVSGSEYYAIYPQSPKTTVSGNVAYIELPATQKCQDINKTMNFLPTFNPMAATSADHNNLEFKNLCGIVVVTVTPDQDLTLTEIILETADAKALCGAATVTMGATPTMEMTEVTTANKQVSLACENMALTAGTAYSFYIVVPAATYNDFGVKIYTNKKRNEPSLYKVRTNRPLELQAGMITTIGANFNLITREPQKNKVGDKYPYNAD